MKKLFSLAVMLLIVSMISGQGIIRGKITDENGEALIGATVVIKSMPTSGTTTDYDGNYSLKIPMATQQIIVAQFVGYHPVEDTVQINKNEVEIHNFDMVPITSEIGEVTVVAKAARAKESYMEKIKVNSVASLDFISAEVIKRTGDASVSAAVSRITGVSTFGGFITVRGIGDRYIKTTINGMKIPTLDPFTNNIKLDLFPSSLVDNIIVVKTASADLPGDWAGAYLSVETKDYPDKLTVNLETSFGYNSQSTFEPIVSSEKSKTDWLGFDNNFREIQHQKPAYYDLEYFKYQEFSALGLQDFFNSQGINENTYWDVNDYTSIYTRMALVELDFLPNSQFYNNNAIATAVEQYNSSEMKQVGLRNATENVVKMGQSLPNRWLTIERKAPLDFSQNFTLGNQVQLFKRPFGFLIGFRYGSLTQYDKNSFYGRSEQSDESVSNLDDPLSHYLTYGKMQNCIETNGWSGLATASYKFNPNNSVTLVFMPNTIGVNRARYSYTNSIQTGSPTSYYAHSQFYESRIQMVYQFKGEHYLPSKKIKIEENASYTAGTSDAPDYRQIQYLVDPQTNNITRLYWTSIESGNFRIFRYLNEDLFDSHLSVELPIGDNSNLPRKIKLGGAYQNLKRQADQRSYVLPPHAIDAPVYNNDIPGYLSIDSFGFDNGRVKRYYNQLTGPEHNTIGFSNTLAGFAMIDYTIVPAIRFSTGLSVESAHLHTDIQAFYEKQYSTNDDRRFGVKPGMRDQIFYLPSASLIWQVKREIQSPMNLRFNYSQTMALPSLRELTPFKVYDYVLLGVVIGNASLKPVNINNFDVRFESFFQNGNNFSVSLFYKNFKNHIELIRQDLDEVYYSWQNAEKSNVVGIELEGRFAVSKNFEFRANSTFVKSQTKLASDSVSRNMYGQAPYVFNVLFTYTAPKPGFSASVTYNVQGPKLVIAGNQGAPDIYELPRNIIDLKFTKTLGKHFTASLRVRDLLNTSVRRSYKYSAGWLDFDKFTYGTNYLFGIVYNLN